jgi:hypothetical protein
LHFYIYKPNHEGNRSNSSVCTFALKEEIYPYPVVLILGQPVKLYSSKDKQRNIYIYKFVTVSIWKGA